MEGATLAAVVEVTGAVVVSAAVVSAAVVSAAVVSAERRKKREGKEEKKGQQREEINASRPTEWGGRERRGETRAKKMEDVKGKLTSGGGGRIGCW